MTKIVSLCPSCSACPAIEIDENEVRIGEGDNLVRLSPAEWNVLVRAIRAEEVGEIGLEKEALRG
jgi:hypothetical protein